MSIDVLERLAGTADSIYTGERRAAPGSRRRFLRVISAGDLFYPQSILFQSVNSGCARAVAVACV